MVVSAQRRAIGVFSSSQEAENALNELKASGFAMDKVSVIAKNAQQDVAGVETSDRVGDRNVNSATAVIADASTTATWGTILVGLTGLALPGIGPVIAAGSLGAALITNLAGVAAGSAAAGSLVKALTDFGIPEEQARVYSDRLHQGDYLVTVDGADDDIRRAEEIFSNRGIQNWGIYGRSAS